MNTAAARRTGYLLITAVVAFVGCSGDDVSDVSSPTEPSKEQRLESADLSPTEPYPFTTVAPPLDDTPIDGIYTRALTVEDIGAEPVYCRRCAPYRLDAGDYTLRFEQGRYFVSLEPVPTERRCKKCGLPPAFASSGHFTIEGDEIVLFNDTSCTRMTGRYRWLVDGDALLLETIEDECPFSDLRPRFLTSYPWTRVGSDPD